MSFFKYVHIQYFSSVTIYKLLLKNSEKNFIIKIGRNIQYVIVI